MKVLTGFFLGMALVFSALSAQAAWVTETFYADYPVIREYQVYEYGPFRQVDLRVLNGAMRVHQADMMAADFSVWGLWGLQGDYVTHQYRWMSFHPTFVRTIRLHVQSLQRGVPVTLQVVLQ